MRLRTIDLGLSVIASIAAILLSWPYWRDFSYWAESPIAWKVYFSVGFLLAVYVFYIFIGSLRTLFEHDEIERADAARGNPGSDREGGRP